ncbi:unnamed protein product [Moneuplotes crassus]|uniref:Mevalonate kinase n=1 Tax=Euplotes crassus TaxID=5936 RepID=A0AAD1XCH8_EUPCR|nr:unnamed protein product [Moneuplotes crassus]
METEAKALIDALFTAPGKVFLSGEYSVTYGSDTNPAIAFTIDKRTQCHVKVFKREEGFPFLDIECKFFKIVLEQYEQLEDISQLETAEIGALTTFIEAVKESGTDLKEFTEKYFITIEMKYAFPSGIGLGSSASYNVALAAAINTVARKLSNGSFKDMTDIAFTDVEDQWRIRTIADIGEKEAHKSISGAESAVISLGGIYKYSRNMTEASEVIEASAGLHLSEDFKFDLIDTGIHRTPKDSLDDMVTMHQQYPEIFLYTEESEGVKKKYSNESNIKIFNAVMEAICCTTNSIEALLKEATYDSDHLSHLVNTNHRLLESIKAGAEIIDEIVVLANRHKVGAKIVGAGFGGCMIAIYNTNSQVQEFKDAVNALSEKGVCFIPANFSKLGIQCESWEHR